MRRVDRPAEPSRYSDPLEKRASGMGDHLKWTAEAEELQRRDTEAKHIQLQAARTGLDSLRAEITMLEQEAAAFPPAVLTKSLASGG